PNLVGDDSQILGDERDLAHLGAQRLEQRIASPRLPFAEARGRRAGRDRPIRLERAEVVDAQQIEALELRADALEPPTETALLHRGPVVERITPELTVGVEVVRRHAGDRQRMAARIDREEIALPPDVDVVAIDVERQVAEKTDAAIVRVTLQRGPLELEQILLELERTKLLAA